MKNSRLGSEFRDVPGRFFLMAVPERTPRRPLHPCSCLASPKLSPAEASFLASRDPCHDPVSQCHTHVFKLNFTSLILRMSKHILRSKLYFASNMVAVRQGTHRVCLSSHGRVPKIRAVDSIPLLLSIRGLYGCPNRYDQVESFKH